MHKTSRNQKPTRRRRGFTLIEIIVVVTIIALLAGMISLRLFGIVGQSKQKVAKTEASSIANALKLYLLETGAAAETGMDLGALLLPPAEGGGPSGPYIDQRDALVDPWGNAYFVRVPGEVNVDFDVVSYGSDGQPGGDGEAADVVHGT